MRESRHTGLRSPLVDSLCWILAIVATLIFIFPLYWAVSTSLRNPADTFTVAGIGIPFLDFEPTLANFRTELSTPEGLRALRTSIFVSISATLLALIIGMPAAYAWPASASGRMPTSPSGSCRSACWCRWRP